MLWNEQSKSNFCNDYFCTISLLAACGGDEVKRTILLENQKQICHKVHMV